MLIEERIEVNAPLEKVWQTFIEIACWADWNSVLQDIASANTCIREGDSFRCSVRPYAFPIFFEPEVEKVITHEKVVWTGKKFGIRSQHEYLFHQKNGVTEVISREMFTGLPVDVAGPLFPSERLKQLNIAFLNELKNAVEQSASDG